MKIKQWLRWLIAIILIAVGLLFINSTLAHIWAAGVLQNSEYHTKWYKIFFVAALISFVSSFIWLWLTRQSKRKE
jgi:tetrahydromethanopterin S-methyltransferase subunit D